jgi:hypothetical protein
MKLKMILAGVAMTASLTAFGAAHAAPIFINFDAVPNGADIESFYDGDGGTDGFGDSGPNLGVNFIDMTATTDFGATSQPTNVAVDAGDPAYINVAAGFSGGLSFTQGLFSSTFFNVYSGLTGNGTELASVLLPASNPGAFAPVTIRFSGVAESVLIYSPGVASGAGIDDLTLGVPEPATWALMIVGFGSVGAMLRRRAVVVA